jgi:drug/metabolite transporter (DMT)-like permease
MSTRDTDAEADVNREVDRSVDPNPYERGKWLSGIIALLGAWMILQSFLFDMVASQFWNDIIVGALLLGVGGYNYSRRDNDKVGSVGAAAIVALLGLWLIAAPFMFGWDAGTTEAVNPLVFWNDVAVGLITLGLGAFSAYAARDQKQKARRLARET